MKKGMHTITMLLLAAFGLALAGYLITQNGVMKTVAISLGITAYHFAMRLFVGFVVDQWSIEKINYQWPWFRQRKFEPALYQALGVKKWKAYIPTYESERFDMKRHGLKYIIASTCQAELVHEIIILLCFLPICTSRFFGALWVMVITSVLSAAVDSTFVMLQRYNRPRLVKLLERKRPN